MAVVFNNKPVIQTWGKRFWDDAEKGIFSIQKCDDCGKTNFFPKKICPHCGSENIGWTESTGKGKIYTFCCEKKEYVKLRYGEDEPKIIAMIELDDGCRYVTNIVDCNPEDVHIGMPVEVAFREVGSEGDQFTLPVFKPVR